MNQMVELGIYEKPFEFEIDILIDNNKASEADLSVIIPVRSDNFEFYQERLKYRKNIFSERIYTILVDDGSLESVSVKFKDLCGKLNWGYIKIKSENSIFSLSRARNVGIKNAKSEWIYMDDADMVYEANHFVNILQEISVFDLHPFNFLTVPAIYMSEQHSRLLRDGESCDRVLELAKSGYMFEVARGAANNSMIQHYAPASGIILLRRKLALLAGGYDESFVGWGGEDRDFVFRLLSMNDNIYRPTNFEETKDWNLNDTHMYQGWRSLYKIIGEYMSRKGIYSYHVYHDKNEWFAEGIKNNNLDIVSQRTFNYKKIKCISDKDKFNDIIIGYNPHIVNGRIREVYNSPVIWDETSVVDPIDYADEIINACPASVTMWNPYGSDWRLKLYDALVDRGITPIVAERGALPHSIYFDRGGLCIVSDSYDAVHWDRDLSDEEQARAREYISSLRFGDAALEKQSGRIGGNGVRQALGVAPGVKIFLAPLQLYDDTVTTFFSEPNRSYQDYIDELKKLALALPNGWVLVYKNHPLSIKTTSIPGGLVADSFHINDLIEAAEVVSVFNSGTGLLASAFDKVVLYYGPCFYKCDYLNWKFADASSVLSFLNNIPCVDLERRDRFFYYLRFKFYSYAEMISGQVVRNKLSKRSKLKQIIYKEIRIPGFEPKVFDESVWEPWNSTLFDSYRHHRLETRSSVKTAKSVNYAAARKAFHNREYAVAAQIFEQLAKNETGSAQALRCAAECYVAMNDIKTAKHILQRAINVVPQNKSVRRRLAKIENKTWRARFMRSYAYEIPQP